MINGDKDGMLFFDAPGGTNKTLLINLVHSTFKIPLDLYAMDIPICSIKKALQLIG